MSDAPVPSTERLLELATTASATADTMRKDCEDFMAWMPTTKAAAHYALVIQQQTDIATALRALLKARELTAEWQAKVRDPEALEWHIADYLEARADELTAIIGGVSSVLDELTAIIGADGNGGRT